MKKNIIVIFLLFIFIVGIFNGCYKTSLIKYNVFSKNGVTHFGNGYLYWDDGVPFLSVEGTPYEMGLQYGVLLKKQLNKVYSQLDHLEKSIFRNLPVYLRPLIGIFISVKLIFIKHSLSAEFKDELRGISDGSGVSYEKLLLISMLPEIFNFSCTSFVKIVKGHLIHGRNFDYYFPMIGKNPLVIRYNPTNSVSYTLIGCVGYTGAYTGMNDYGITITVDASPIAHSNVKFALPVTYQVRRVLENAKSMSDVEKLFKGYRSVKGWMVIVGDSSGKSASVFNIAGDKVSETKMNNNEIFVTNTFIDDKFAHKYMALSDAESASSVCRYERISALIGNINSVKSALNALSDFQFYNYGNVLGAGDVTVNNEGTLQTVVMDPVNNSIYFSSSSEGMYSGFDKVIKVDSTFKNYPIVYKKPDPILERKEFIQFAEWFRKAEVYYLEGNYKEAFNLVKDIEKPNLMQLEGEENVAEKIGCLKKDITLIKKADYLIDKYPEYILPYIVKAKVLFANKRYKDTITTCNLALKTRIKPLFYETEVYYLLARSYEKIGNIADAKQFANLCVKIINNYAKGKKELRMLTEINKILQE